MTDNKPKIESYDEIKKRALNEGKQTSKCAMDW